MIKILHVTDSSYPYKGKSKIPSILQKAHDDGLIDLKKIDLKDKKTNDDDVIISINEYDELVGKDYRHIRELNKKLMELV